MKIYIEKRKSKNGKLYTRAYYESTSPDGSKCFHNTLTFDKWAIGAMLGGISEYHKMKECDVYEVQLDTCYRVLEYATKYDDNLNKAESSSPEATTDDDLPF